MAARPPWIGQYKHLKNAKTDPKCKYATFMQAYGGMFLKKLR